MEHKKYKLLIIDDEYFVVRGLRETIDWAALNIEVVADCGNGQQGLDAVHRYAPDLVISDIRMPVMDGIALAAALRKENYDGAVIFYSGYGDFEYARKALEFGIVKYLLKPIDNDTLVKTVRETLAALESDREKRDALKAYNIGLPLMKGALLAGALGGDRDATAKLKAIGAELPEKEGLVIYGELCYFDGEAGTGDGSFGSFYARLVEFFGAYATIAHKYEDYFVIVTAMTDVPAIKSAIERYFDLLSGGNRVFVGISKPLSAELNVCDAYAETKALRRGVLFPSVNCVLAAGSSEVSPRKKLVMDALDIIAKNYDKKLSPEFVAEKLYISVSHLMHELKEALGKTFIDCLTEYRMLKAKEMLTGGGYRINEIAAGVGYADVRYFSQVFKKMTGKTPTEYAESVSKQ